MESARGLGGEVEPGMSAKVESRGLILNGFFTCWNRD